MSCILLFGAKMKNTDTCGQIELKTDNAWGIIVSVMNRLMQLPATSGSDALCKYLMLKDPNKPLLNLYHVPLDAFDFEVWLFLPWSKCSCECAC
jgi:translation initiation factor 3 subunit D